METKEFTVAPKFKGGPERVLIGRQVKIPAGRAAFDLETGRTVKGPATIWQAVKAGAGEPEEIPETGEAEKPRRGRPTTKKTAAPPDL